MSVPKEFNQRLQDLDKTIYIEVIEEFRDLHYGLQDKLVQELRTIYGPYFNFSEEYLARLLNNPKITSMQVILVRERKNHRLVAANMTIPCYFEFLENDHRPENQFLTGHGVVAVIDEYRMSGLVTIITELNEQLMFALYPNTNMVEYGFAISPYSYYFCTKRSKLSIPDGNKIEPNVMKLFEKINSIAPIRAKRVGKDPFLHTVFPPVHNDLSFILENIDRLPPLLKYFVDQTGLIPGVGILTMQVLYMREGNTAGLPAGDYMKRRFEYKGQINYIQGNPTHRKPIPKI
ncbi:hypothetical protein SteCoe_16912 [Stentor coeruleus]|uniref:Uncharacterized protein n=1 Tax=Stentor coeruleus TaxID=5963 RepID=A0A1R2C050_9CILI|nr:hypothetical protein SteCoe_16912 [Stentor coeruleus]